MKIERASLLAAMAQVKGGRVKKDAGSDVFVFRDGRIHTFSDEIAVSYPIADLKEEGVVSADALEKLLAKMTGDEVDVSFADTQMTVESDGTKAGLVLVPEHRHPKVSQEGKWKSVPEHETFREALEFAMYACAEDLSTPVLTCVHIHSKGVEGLDNYRATTYAVKSPIRSTLIPASSIQKLVATNFEEVFQTDDGWLHFRTPGDCRFSCRTFVGDFPDLAKQKLFEVDGTALKLPKSIDDILARIQIFAEREFFLDERVEVTLANKRMRVRAEGPAGWIEDEVNIHYDGEPHSFTTNPGLLVEMIPKTRNCVVGKDRMRFDGKDWMHVVSLTTNKEKADGRRRG